MNQNFAYFFRSVKNLFLEGMVKQDIYLPAGDLSSPRETDELSHSFPDSLAFLREVVES